MFSTKHEGEVIIHKTAGASTVKESEFNGRNNRWNHKKRDNNGNLYRREFDDIINNHIQSNPSNIKEIKSI